MEKITLSLTAVKSIEEFHHAKNIVKDNGEKFFTNLYVGDDLLTKWINRGQIFGVVANKSFFILRLRREFWHLYFLSNDLNVFANELSDLTSGINSPISTDLVRRGGGGMEGDIDYSFREARFNQYITLTRMSRLNKPAESVTNSEWFAELSDVHAVDEIIHENMNPLCEQIPDIEEIAEAIKNHQVLATRHKSEIASILYFERNGATTTLRFWATRKKYHGQGFGGTVYEKYFAVNADAQRWLLWVRDDNLKVKKIYQNYGMNYEDLHDSVYLLMP